MSLFHVNPVWEADSVESDEYDVGSLVVANLNNCNSGIAISLTDKIATGSLGGVLRIYSPGSFGAFSTEDLMCEYKYPSPILQLLVGSFITGSPNVQLAVLFPSSLIIFEVSSAPLGTKKGAPSPSTETGEEETESSAVDIIGSALSLSPLYTADFSSFLDAESSPVPFVAANACVLSSRAPVGSLAPSRADMIAVLSSRGSISLVSFDTPPTFPVVLSEVLVPGPLCHLPTADAVAVSTSDMAVATWSLSALAAHASQRTQTPLEPSWRLPVGLASQFLAAARLAEPPYVSPEASVLVSHATRPSSSETLQPGSQKLTEGSSWPSAPRSFLDIVACGPRGLSAFSEAVTTLSAVNGVHPLSASLFLSSNPSNITSESVPLNSEAALKSAAVAVPLQVRAGAPFAACALLPLSGVSSSLSQNSRLVDTACANVGNSAGNASVLNRGSSHNLICVDIQGELTVRSGTRLLWAARAPFVPVALASGRFVADCNQVAGPAGEGGPRGKRGVLVLLGAGGRLALAVLGSTPPVRVRPPLPPLDAAAAARIAEEYKAAHARLRESHIRSRKSSSSSKQANQAKMSGKSYLLGDEDAENSAEVADEPRVEASLQFLRYDEIPRVLQGAVSRGVAGLVGGEPGVTSFRFSDLSFPKSAARVEKEDSVTRNGLYFFSEASANQPVTAVLTIRSIPASTTSSTPDNTSASSENPLISSEEEFPRTQQKTGPSYPASRLRLSLPPWLEDSLQLRHLFLPPLSPGGSHSVVLCLRALEEIPFQAMVFAVVLPEGLSAARSGGTGGAPVLRAAAAAPLSAHVRIVPPLKDPDAIVKVVFRPLILPPLAALFTDLTALPGSAQVVSGPSGSAMSLLLADSTVATLLSTKDRVRVQARTLSAAAVAANAVLVRLAAVAEQAGKHGPIELEPLALDALQPDINRYVRARMRRREARQELADAAEQHRVITVRLMQRTQAPPLAQQKQTDSANFSEDVTVEGYEQVSQRAHVHVMEAMDAAETASVEVERCAAALHAAVSFYCVCICMRISMTKGEQDVLRAHLAPFCRENNEGGILETLCASIDHLLAKGLVRKGSTKEEEGPRNSIVNADESTPAFGVDDASAAASRFISVLTALTERLNAGERPLIYEK